MTSVWAPKRLLTVVAVTFSLYVLIGLVLHVTIKDAFPILSTAYYGTPLPIMTIAATVAGLVWRRLGTRQLAWLSFLAGTLCAGWAFQHSYAISSQERHPSDSCVVFWNVSSGRLGLSEISATLQSQKPDIIGLAETGGPEATHLWQQAFPDYHLTVAQQDMLLLTKHRSVRVATGSLNEQGWFEHLRVKLGESLLNVVLVDIESNPLQSRRYAIEELADIALHLEGEPVLIMGDFNTLADSVHFTNLRRTCVNAFESYGNGYSATWPIPLPVLQLDHIWANRHVSITGSKTMWTY